jgi:mannose-6-phosphate isomerase-like protein (cupin superfamily)
MKRLRLLTVIAIPILVVPAQEASPKGFEPWTNRSLEGYTQRLHEDAATDPHHFAVEQLADFSNDGCLLVHKEADGQVEWHETQADVFFVRSGSATLVVGGTLLNGETVGPHEKRNGSIQGGVREKLSAGDVVRIPPRVPHQILLESSHPFDYFVVKVKEY